MDSGSSFRLGNAFEFLLDEKAFLVEGFIIHGSSK